MKRKLMWGLGLLLILSATLCLICGSAFAEDSLIVDSGTCGDNLTWTLDENGTLTITGTGEMKNYSYNTIPWYNSKGSINSVVILSGVTTIGDYSFYACYKLVDVTIDTKLTSIGKFAFAGCRKMTDITIPGDVVEICNNAFTSCDSLKSVVIPDNVTYIGECAFGNCKELTTVKLPDSINTVSAYLFKGCTSLTKMELPKNITSIETGAFENCSSMESITISPQVKRIGWYAFQGCRDMTNLEIPNSVTTIGRYAFADCTYLSSISLPDSITSIDYNTFENCENLETITIPSSVKTICGYAFRGCKFGLRHLSIPDGVTSIGSYAFEKSGLQSIVIPDSITKIGEYAFADCSYLSSISLPCGLKTIEKSTFEKSGLKNIVIPDSTTIIDENAFRNCSNLSSVTVGRQVSSICQGAFYECNKLEKIFFLGSAPEIVYSIFNNVKSYAYYSQGDTSWTVDVMQNYGGTITWMAWDSSDSTKLPIYTGTCGNNLTWTLYDEGTLIIRGTGDMDNWSYYSSPWYYADGNRIEDKIRRVVIEPGVTSIGSFAFDACHSVSSISIPNTVNTIHEYAFSHTSITDISIPNSVSYIGEYAFSWCIELANVDLPNNLSSINEYTFNCCFRLPYVTIPQSVTCIGEGAFSDCDDLLKLTIPKSVTEIKSKAFQYCDKLINIRFNGDAPSLDDDILKQLKATVFYPPDNITWANSILTQYGGTIIWKPIGESASGDLMDELQWFTDDNGALTITGHDGDNVTWTLDDNGILRISGNGKMEDHNYYGSEPVPWFYFRNHIKHASIQAGITHLSGHAFIAEQDDKINNIGYYRNLKSVVIARTVDSIGVQAFYGCYNLKNIYFWGDAPAIQGENVFSGPGPTTDYNRNIIEPQRIVIATVHFPAGNNTWTNDVMQNYGGEITWVPWEVDKIYGTSLTWMAEGSLSDCTVTLDATSYTYDGTAKKPVVTVTCGDTTLIKDTDYTVAYSSNTNVGTASVTVTGKGSISGTATCVFIINPADLSTATVTITSPSYNGKALTPVPAVMLGNKTLTMGTDYALSYDNNVNVGTDTATVTVTGNGNFTGTITKSFTIRPKPLTAAMATLSATSYTFNGSAKKPGVTVKDGTKTLVKDTDYTVAYKNNTNVGTATVIVTGKGNYTGTITKSFIINPKALVASGVTLSTVSYTYNGSAKKPGVTVKDGTKTLTANTDYTVTYAAGRINAGTYKVTVTGKGNYTGTITKTFTIKPKAITPTVTLSKTALVYNGQVQKPTVTVKDGTTTLTTANYTVTWPSGCKVVGTYKVTVKLKGNYSGSKAVSYIINPQATTMTKVTAASKAFTAAWTKQATQTTGYQIQYSLSSTFASGNKTALITKNTTLSKKVTGLTAKKKYYVRVRTYKTVGSTKYYSAWSKALAVTTKA